MNKILILLIILPLMSIGQGIEKNYVDKFTKVRKIETSFVKISSGNFSGPLKNVWLSANAEDDKGLLNIKWNTGGILRVPEGAILIFLTRSDKQLEFINRYSEVSSKGAGTVGVVGSSDYGVNLYFDGDVAGLSKEDISDFRLQTNDGYVDFTVLPQAKKKLEKLFKVFYNELEKSID